MILPTVEMTWSEYFTESVVPIDCVVVIDNSALRYTLSGVKPTLHMVGININKAGNYYAVGRPPVEMTKEAALDAIRNDYPELFDWLLWNPGWL